MYTLLASPFPAKNPENSGRKNKMSLLLHVSDVTFLSNLFSTLTPIFDAPPLHTNLPKPFTAIFLISADDIQILDTKF